MRALKAIALLLAYPSPPLLAAMPELRAEIEAERSLPRRDQEALAALSLELERGDLLELQAQYSALFDHGRASSFHLYEHLHGESRERGLAMVALKALYASQGVEPAEGELPDALPVVLEFLSMQREDEARSHIRDAAEALQSLGAALAARGSNYAAVPRVLLAWAGAPGFVATVIRPEVPTEAEWSEPPVSFSPVRAAVNQVIHWAKKR